MLAACKEEEAATGGFTELEEEAGPDSAEASDGDTDTDDGDGIEPGADICLGAALVGPGTYRGDLRGKDSNNGGACELGGPDVFFTIDVPRRADVMLSARGAGYEPRIGVRHSDCASSFEDTGLLCVSGVPGWVHDLARGTQLIVSVGIDANAPVLASTEPLPFELDVAIRPVLAAGEGCQPSAVGRCESGTRCNTDLVPAECDPVPGDTCRNPLPLVVRAGATTVQIPADAIHDDAHAHSCSGERAPDRVYRVELVGDLGEAARVEVDAPWSVGLAARGPGCLPEEELRGPDPACAADGEPLVVVAPPPSFYLFVELPDPAERDPTGGEEAPAELGILFDPG